MVIIGSLTFTKLAQLTYLTVKHLRILHPKKLMSIFFLSLVLISCKGTKKFQEARSIDSIEAYEQFIANKPKSPFVQNANDRLNHLHEEQMWSHTKTSSRVIDFEAYLKKYPQGSHISEATTSIEKLVLEKDWRAAETIGTERSYSGFIDKHPLSAEAQSAKSRIEELKMDKAWTEAKASNTVNEYEVFEEMYPNSKHHGQIVKTIQEMNAALLNDLKYLFKLFSGCIK